MRIQRGVLLLASLLAYLHLGAGRPFFRRYQHYNRFMKKMALNFEKAKVETLGAIFKRHVQQLRHTHNKQVELVFLIDSSGTVGRYYFYEELRFVKNLLADFTVDMNSTRVSVITFSSPHKIYRHIDYLTHPHTNNHKCRLLHEDIPDVTYTPGGTHTLGALLEAEKVLRSARPDATKAIFLMTDGYSNGGDPRPVAHKLKAQGVTIFTFGIRDGFVWELQDMASNPKNETCYILDSFEEFEALAKRALHTDLQSGSHITQSVSKCGKLCNNGDKCCHDNATCTCGTYTGKYDCLCNPGFYGTGRGKTGCKSCPPGTFKNFTGQGGPSLCLPCPDENQITPPGAQSEKQCTCKRGYRSFGSKACTVARCEELTPPKHGYFINSKCNNVFNAACGLRCNSGYELHGSSLRICQEDGSWSGQTAKCIMKTCPSLHQPKNGHMICSTDDFSYSTICRFTCNNGYQLVGSRKRTCLAIAFWTGIATRCREITCPPLAEIKDGVISPSSCLASEVVFGTVCQISCGSGYTLKGPHTKQCTPDGTWMVPQKGPNQCIDETPPVLRCPDNIEIVADEEEDTTEVSWREPVPVDNSGLLPLLSSEPAVTPGSRFPIGLTKITYKAEDLSKNIAECSFQIKVIDKTPPRVDRCPVVPEVVSTGRKAVVTLEPPEFSDNSGKPVDFRASRKSTDLFPVGTTRVVYTAFDASNNNSTCIIDVVVIPHLCVSPEPPKNGNISCKERESGVRCRISCMDGYTFINPVAEQGYVCNYKTGDWMPPEYFPFPDCAVVEASNDILQPASVTLTGDISCKDRKSLLEIAENLEEEMKEKLRLLCEDNGLSCSLSNLKSVCEDEESFNKIPLIVNKKRKKRELRSLRRQRRRRSVDEGSVKFLRYRRNASPKRSKISFDITLTGSRSNAKETKDMKAFLAKALKNLLTSFETQPKTLLTDKNKTLTVDAMSFDVKKAKYKCPEGSLLTDKTCIYCPVGTFHDPIQNLCQDCPKGTYQDKEGQTSCIRCPDGKATEKLHSRNAEDCKALCKPGTFSATGLEPCETCLQGFYQAGFSSKTCFPCTDGKTTKRRGCSSKEKCEELCPPGHASKTGLAPCLPCPTTAYQPKSGQSECLLCPAQGSTGIRGAISLSSCSMAGDSWEVHSDIQADSSIEFNECDFDNPCQNGGTCTKGEGSLFTCQCPDGYGGQTCKDIIDQCKSDPCRNKGLCLSSKGSFTCTCLDGFIGPTCDINIDDCVTHQCQNEATCEDGINSYTCKCKPGYTGKLCDQRIDECEEDPCLNGGNCTMGPFGVLCQCESGFTGQLCEVDMDECFVLPCQNEGNCVDLPGAFRCECKAGFTGKTCEINIDECALFNPCQNGGQCVDGLNEYTCDCPDGFDGAKCEDELTPYYQLDFINPSIMDFARLSIDRPLNSVTASLWIKTTDDDSQGTPFSYGVRGQPDAFTITDYRNLNVYINGEQRSTGLALTNGQWQHFVFTWSSVRGDWKVYVNGLLMDQGYDLSTSKAIPGRGTFIIGQEQDSEGGDFSAGETFVGSLTQLNIWDRELSLDDIEKLRFSCESFYGNVIAWPDVRTALQGDVTATPSKFCQDCPIPEAPSFGSVDYTGVRPDDDVTYACQTGYITQGRATFKCLVSGEWENPPTRCRPITCSDPGPIRNGYITGADFRFNKRIRFFCNRGYELDGARSLLCTEYGDWDDDKPTCVAITCNLPQLSVHTVPSITKTSVSPGTAITFTCTLGHRLQTDHDSVLCQMDGSFDKSVPTCDPEKCYTPPAVPNAEVIDPKAEYGVGEIVKYRCQFGYDFDPYAKKPIDSVNCLPSGDWESDLPICNEIYCPEPPVLRKGVSEGEGRIVGSEVTYSCEPGYKGTGKNVITCRGLGDWTRLSFRCRPVNCKEPPPVLFGTSVGSEYTFTSVVSYQCDQGYQRDGPRQRQCQANGTWSQSDPFCRPIDCGKPPEISFGSVEAQSTMYSNTASYSCNQGYILNGLGTLTCEANGQWSPEAPICEPRPCQVPDYVPFGTSTSPTQLVYNSNIEYTCNTGYEMTGSRVRVCTADGTWSPEAPVCEVVKCNFLFGPTFGSIDVENHTYSSVARYSCDPDHKLVGVDTRTCQANGQWSDTAPECQRTKCETPDPIDHMIIDYKDIEVGSIVRYSCESGYELVGTSTRRCQENFLLSEEEPFCRPVECEQLDALENGKIYLSQDDLKYGTAASFACEEGFILIGVEEITCIFDGTWSGGLPTCQPVECPKPGRVISNGRMLGSSFMYKSLIAYQCDDGYDMIGAPNRTCLSDGRWDNPVPICQSVECPRPRLVYGSVSTFKRSYGTVVEFSCRGNYRLDGPAKRTCMANGQWSGEDPRCLKINCDVPDPVANAQSSVVNETAVLYQCDKGYELKGSALRICGADERWRPRPPTCVKSDCNDLSDAELANGKVLFTRAKVGDYVRYECNKGYRLRGESQRRCLPSTKWDGDEPVCQIVSCGHPGILEDGSVIGNDYTYNATVRFECNPGYQLADVKSIRCLESGYWEDLYPFCEVQLCAQLDPTIDSGSVSVSSYKVGGEATYTCDVGYRMEGESIRTCQLDGEWSVSEPVCVEVKCPQPEPVEHAVMFGWKEAYEYGDKVEYECDPGYYIASDNRRYCTEESKWTEWIPQCISVNCPELPFVENGRVDGESASFQAVITYGCNPGYELIGEVESTCQADSTWSGDERICTRISCGQPPSIDNAFISESDGFFFGDSVIYSCNVGYTPSGNDMISCQADETWSDGDYLCTIVSCPSILEDDVPNAIFNQDAFTYGTIVSFTCQTGYSLSGPSALTCTPLGYWDDNYPRCTIVICPKLPPLQFGTVLADSEEYGSVASFSCNIGYTLIGATDASCLASGEWSAPMPVCQIVSCPELLASNFLNGRFRATSFTYGGTIDFGCDEGFIMTGSRTISCTSDGSWDAEYPRCVIVTCPVLGSLDFGTVFFTSVEYGSRANFSCNSGYYMVGSHEITCLASGFWSDNMPVCRIVSCPDISASDIPDGNFYGTTFTFKSLINFTCNEGYRMSGASSVECLATGLWNARYPVCNIVTCPKLGSLEYGTVQSESVEFGSSATFVCNVGYSLLGHDEITCLATGLWNDVMPLCQINSCPDILASDFINGNFTNGPFTYGSRVDFTCYVGYRLIGSSSLQCLADRRWDNSYPVCEIVVCPKLPSMDFGTVFALSDSYGSSATFSCVTGYNRIGAEEIVCLASGKWSASMPYCEIVTCPEIYSTDIPNGSFQATTFTFDSLVFFKCNEGYILFGSSALICTSGGTWNTSYPVCNIITCPTVGEVEFGTVFADSLEYGSVATFSCNTGYSLIGYEKISCLSTGVWSETAPFCQIISCPDILPSDIANGYFNATEFTYGNLVYFFCNEGYLPSGPMILQCTHTGSWNASFPLCTIVKCPDLQKLSSGTVISESYEYGSTAGFVCDKGYTLRGSRTIACLSSGIWNDSLPACTILSCETPPAIENGEYEPHGLAVVYGNRARYSCNFGYKMLGSDTLTCTEFGTFDISPPACSRVLCPGLKDIDFGRITTVNDTFVSFSCLPGFYLEGESILECLLGGNWSTSPPACLPIPCPTPPEIENGKYTGDVFSFGSYVTYKCEKGHELRGYPILVCQEDGNWSGDNVKCVPISCGVPDALENGYIVGDVFTYKQTIEYFCNDGFELKGKNNRTCRRDGTWSRKVPRCVRLSCTEPDSIANGYFNGSDYRYESEIVYGCFEGYIITGNTRRRCESSLTWSGVEPFCERAPCSSPPHLPNGFIEAESFVYEDVINISCKAGFELVGLSYRVCLADGLWSGQDPTCDEIFCPFPPKCDFCQILLPQDESQFRVNTSAKYQCDEGYVLNGTDERICETSGQWSDDVVECNPVPCPPIPSLQNGFISYNDPFNPFTYLSLAFFSCNQGFQLEGSPYIECMATGRWSAQFSRCLIKECPPLQVDNGFTVLLSDLSDSGIDLGIERKQGQHVAGDAIRYSCNTGYQMNGPENSSCSLDAVWSSTSTSCFPVPCPLPDIQNAFFSRSFAVFGDTATVTCEKGLDLIGEDELTCGANGTWREELPRCVLLTCGSPPFVDHSVLKGDSFQLGDMAAYECKRGYDLIGNSLITCGPGNQWLGSPPVCVEVDCGIPDAVLNSMISYTSTTYKSTAVIACDLGFILQGRETVECGAERLWVYDPVVECVPRDCGLPPGIHHGTYDAYDTTFGAVVFYMCDPGYFFLGSSSMQCDEDGNWGLELPVCSPVVCTEPPRIEHGSVTANATYFSGVAVYTCHVGYTFIDDKATSLACDDMGTWKGTIPECAIVRCGVPPIIENSDFSLSDNNTHYSSIATYSCLPGHESEARTVLTCAASSLWEGSRYVCRKKNCFDYPPLSNGEYSSQGDTLFGAQIFYTCFLGHVKIGPDVITCQEDGQWSSRNHYCVPIDCSYPPSLAHATVSVENTTYKSLGQYSCDLGYHMEGNATAECLHTGLWSSVGQCKALDCQHPPEIDNGNVSFTLTTFQSKALYSCRPGYSLGDSNVLECGGLGDWEGPTPRCDIMNCSDPNIISHGTVEYLETSYLSEAFYSCFPGYRIIGKDKISCLEDGTWSDVNPTCHPLNCSLPDRIDHGAVTFTGTTFGERADYTCHVGHTMQGSPVAYCGENGGWNTSAPICTPIVCPAPQEIENSILSFASTTFGSQALYECQEGFTMKGSDRITCDETGKWSHADEYRYCQVIDCFEPPNVANAQVSYKDNLFGAIAVYNCLPGFKPETEKILICGQSGLWEGESFTCSKVTCPHPPDILNGDVSYGAVLSVGSQATYNCHRGFSLVGRDVITCSSTSQWSEVPVCAPVQCPPPPSFANAVLVSYDERGFDSRILYQCRPGFRMLNDDGLRMQEVTARCSETSNWRLESSFYCQLIRCSPFPPQIQHGTVSTMGNNFSDLAEYTCDPGYRMEGDSVLTCDEDGRWSSVAAPFCRIVTCDRPPVVPDSTIDGTHFVFGSTVTYRCHYGFQLVGSPTVRCQLDGRWSPADIRCEAIECSLLPDLLNGETQSANENPHRVGSIVTFTCHDGYLLNGPSTLTCLESGHWNDSFPACDKVIGVCLETVELEHGKIPPGKFPGDRVQIQCVEGYQTSGSMTSVCRNDGTWTMPEGSCRRIFCGRPESPDRRNVKVVGRSFQYGDQVVYLCRYGFTPEHRPPRLTCQASGKWDGKPACNAQCKTACQNGGRCLGMNRCKCMPGWVGTRCQQANCIFKCLHGGHCVAPYRCSCPLGYHGSRCQKPVCSRPCQNGGRCIAPNKCRCQGRFHGNQCELLRIGYQQSRP